MSSVPEAGNEQYVSIATTLTSPLEIRTFAPALTKVPAEVEYEIRLKRNGNTVLTPLEVPSFTERGSGTSKNKECIEFEVLNRKGPADSVKIEVLKGEKVIYTESDTSKLLSDGAHQWVWDGYDSAGILDTKVLKGDDLKVRLTASREDKTQVKELKLNTKAKEVDWVDVKVDRPGKQVAIEVRPKLSDGGIDEEKNDNLSPVGYSKLLTVSTQAIGKYWSRDGTRPNGIASPINAMSAAYKVLVSANVNADPPAPEFKLVDDHRADPGNSGRSTSLAGFRKIVYPQGYYFYEMVTRHKNEAAKASVSSVTMMKFEEDAAHEFGHVILNAYEDSWGFPKHSWTHKNTSTRFTQSPLENNPEPTTGEIDLMHYFSEYRNTLPDRLSRTAAAEEDVKALIWLGRIQFQAEKR